LRIGLRTRQVSASKGSRTLPSWPPFAGWDNHGQDAGLGCRYVLSEQMGGHHRRSPSATIGPVTN